MATCSASRTGRRTAYRGLRARAAVGLRRLGRLPWYLPDYRQLDQAHYCCMYSWKLSIGCTLAATRLTLDSCRS